MAELLKNMYNPEFFETICPVFREHIPGFDCKRFVHLVFDNRWPDLELKDRVRHITRALRHFLPEDFQVSSKMIVDISVAFRGKKFANNFALIFLPDYIEVYGIAHPAQSFCALEEITQLISAEFAIRPFLAKYPELSMKQMLTWSKHISPAVRRLSSEGCRPRLPWAPVIPFLTK